MKYFYDTEFLENGRTIELISIGVVAEDGREYYAASYEMPIGRIKKHDWLMENVVPHLPPHSEWKPRSRIRDEVSAFLLDGSEVELWADYCAYDHVVLAQLFGTMMDLPSHVPMFTNDIRSLAVQSGLIALPNQQGGEHDALHDARHVKALYEHIKERSR